MQIPGLLFFASHRPLAFLVAQILRKEGSRKEGSRKEGNKDRLILCFGIDLLGK